MKTKVTKATPTLVVLTAIFVSCMLISNILSNATIKVFAWSMDAGTLVFPLTYILSGIFSEIYGYKWSRRVTWIAAAMMLVFSALVWLVIALPKPEYYDGIHFAIALGGSIRILIASVVAFVTGDFVKDNVFSRLKKLQQGEGFKTRAIISSIFGNAVDSSIFVLIAFLGTMPGTETVPMILLNILFKTTYEFLILPITDRVVKFLHKRELAHLG